MNNTDLVLDKIIALKVELHEQFLKHYAEQELFSVTWWIMMALLIIPLIIWWKTVDKKRLPEIIIYGFACNLIAAFLDVLLSDYIMWEYPVHVIPQISLFIPVDYVIVPVVGMYLYQKFQKWGPFTLASTLVSALMSFVGEPLAVAINMYKLINWRYVYSFPIYITIYVFVKFFTQKVMNIKDGQFVNNTVAGYSEISIKGPVSLTCRVQKLYPSAQIPAKNQAIADMLQNAFADGGNAEITSVAQYINHSDTIKDKSLADMAFCIALVEMWHLDLVGTIIESLVGDLRFWRTNRYYWSGGEADYGQSDCEKISLDTQFEEEALSGYDELLRSIRKTDGPGEQQVEQLMQRIMEDEEFHLQMLKSVNTRYSFKFSLF